MSCGNTTGALDLLKEKGIKCEFIDVTDFGNNGKTLCLGVLGNPNNKSGEGPHATVPIIYDDKGVFVGGFSELQKYFTKN